MANLNIELDQADLLRATGLEQKLAGVSTLYKAWANEVEGLTVEAFNKETAPYGSAWEPLSIAYATRKRAAGATGRGRRRPRAGGNRILRYTGQLYDSIFARVGTDGVTAGFGYRVGRYSLGAIHQFGAQARNIPARPALPIDAQGDPLPELVRELREIAIDYFTGA